MTGRRVLLVGYNYTLLAESSLILMYHVVRRARCVYDVRWLRLVVVCCMTVPLL
ncbi:hypothetical protein CALCODRAFT_497065 [Calocera cornea HHB12733]|uniref:Uncharacterized protein n=1 Tax=Calocera cornea HHB12733 TaxID=1353952 RepID=A0A165FH73_9BASI|nr:hypothetical protein CALCODRAFT_497065 [Calocera cornea HHB12733]